MSALQGCHRFGALFIIHCTVLEAALQGILADFSQKLPMPTAECGGVCYDLWCDECGIKVCAYKGEIGRNCFTRGCEHLENLEARDEEKSVLWLHSVHHHNSRVDVHYSMRTTGSYSDPMDRQLQERVNITNFKGPILMNRRNEMGGVRVERMRYRRWGGD